MMAPNVSAARVSAGSAVFYGCPPGRECGGTPAGLCHSSWAQVAQQIDEVAIGMRCGLSTRGRI